MEASARRESQAGIKPVINATGVLLHTNLGRAPLSEAARAAMDDAARYCSVEYDVESGVRGGRGARVESLLKDLTGAEDALVVNNCAAAALLILTVLASRWRDNRFAWRTGGDWRRLSCAGCDGEFGHSHGRSRHDESHAS